MKKFYTLILSGIFAFTANAQEPTIAGDLLLCPNTNGTAYITTDQDYDSYQWYWKYWFTSDPYEAIPGADGPSFTYDWMTYDQALLKVVVTLDGNTYESNTLQIDSYAWVGLTMGYQDGPDDNIELDPDTGNLMLCAGTGFTIEVYMPYTVVQWYRNGIPISGANNMQYHVTEAGSYHVVAAPGFCPDSTSSTEGLPIVVAIDNDCSLGIGNPDVPLLSYYPNPVSGNLHFTSQYPIQALSVYSISGQKVWSDKPNALSGNADLSGLSSGIYFLEAQTENRSQRFKIVKL